MFLGEVEMSNGEIKDVKTDAVISPTKFRNEVKEKSASETENKLSQFQTRTSVAERKELFGRLKKSLRKKSASIL